MKKKFLIMLSMLALLVCIFAVSASASNYFDLSNADYTDSDSICSFYVYLNTEGAYGSSFVSACDTTFGVLLAEDGNGTYYYGYVNIEWWHSYFTNYGVNSESDFINAIGNLLTLEYIENDSDIDVYLCDSYFSQYYSVYQAYVAELNTPTYEQGKTDGVTEYLASDEYSTALNEQYVEGKADGIEYFKSSKEYENTLSVKYATGLADGKANYIASDEYTTALQAEYDSGYSDGVADTEGEASENKANNTFGIALGASLILILVVVVFYFSPKRKRGR